MKKYLSPESYEWLKRRDDLGFAGYFVGQGVDRADIKWRKAAIEIAAQWCMLHEAGEDGKELSPGMRKLIEPHVKKSNEEGYDAVAWFWATMCAHCAEYSFAQIDEFDQTRALYGIYRTLLPEERKIEPQDAIILEKLAAAAGVDLKTAGRLAFGIQSNGLDSKVMLPAPSGAEQWTEYADQFRIKLLQK